MLRHGLKQGLGHGKAGSKDPALLPELVKGRMACVIIFTVSKEYYANID